MVGSKISSDLRNISIRYGAVISPPRDWDRWDELVPPVPGDASRDGVLELTFDLPMPDVSGLELVPSGTRRPVT